MKGEKAMVTITTTSKAGRASLTLEDYDFQNNRTIWLTEEITPAISAKIVRQIRYLDKSGIGEITLMINSPGGSVIDGLAICDAMKSAAAPVATVCCGMAASMAAVILACGCKGRRKCYKHSEVMIHQLMGGAQGQETDVAIAYLRMKRLKETLNSILSECTGQSLKKIAQDTERDFFMTAEEAVEYGIVDVIV